jgi:predicted ribosomally synthesized peptide with nif11-like leader
MSFETERSTTMNEQLLEKAKTANSAEELLSMAKEEGIELTEAEAAAYFNQLNAAEGELADEELDNVAGGSSCDGREDGHSYFLEVDYNDPGCESWKKKSKGWHNTKSGNRCGNCYHCAEIASYAKTGGAIVCLEYKYNGEKSNYFH